MTRQVLISLHDSSGDGNLGSDRRRRRYSEKGGLLRRDPLQGGHYQELEWGYLETGGGGGGQGCWVGPCLNRGPQGQPVQREQGVKKPEVSASSAVYSAQ